MRSPMNCKQDGLIALEDGTVYRGQVFGHRGHVTGEAVFNTSMTGYQEILTDPSYYQQIVTMTSSQIGNYGVNSEDVESATPKVQGLIVREFSKIHSNWRSEGNLSDYLETHKIPGLAEIDTRALTILLRNKGSMLGAIVQDTPLTPPSFNNPNEENLAAKVTSPAVQIFLPEEKPKSTVLLIDCGSKSNILRSLLKRGTKVVSVPFDYDFLSQRFQEEVSSFQGIVVSNGPGNPQLFDTVVDRLREAIDQNIPMMGICLGHQLIARAAGAKTYKLKYGHRSHNQPCRMEGSQRCFITSQNHGFAVDIESLEKDWLPFFTNVNDGTNEGIRHSTKPVFSVQFHPEAAPGPQDTSFLFDNFLENL